MSSIVGGFIRKNVFACRIDASLFRRVAGRLSLWMAVSLMSAGAASPVQAGDTPRRAPPPALERTAFRDALQGLAFPAARSADPTGYDVGNATDGRDDTAWVGRPGEPQWRLTFQFPQREHLGLLRAHWGRSSISGVPTSFRWEALVPDAGAQGCGASIGNEDSSWAAIDPTREVPAMWGDGLARPTRRSWFVDVEACGLRLVIDRTNGGLPVVREVQAIESADDVLTGGTATDDGSYPGLDASAAFDGEYATRWAGMPGKPSWMLSVSLREPQTIDRVRLVLGFDATRVRRPGGGLSYAVAWAPVRYALEVSEDGEHFATIASEPRRSDGTLLPLRRRLVTLSEPRRVSALRLVMTAASGSTGLPEPDAVPVVRELAAYGADDPRPILSAPWILSVNANPTAQSRTTPGGELGNDAFHAMLLQTRFRALLPSLRTDDQFVRSSGAKGTWREPALGDDFGEGLETIEGDDPRLDAAFIARSSPPPIVVLSGSNDWDYAADTGPDPTYKTRWHWDPLRDAQSGGMAQLARAVQDRAAPFLGFCGGAQILALLEAYPGATGDDHMRLVDQVLERSSGRPIRGFAQAIEVDRAWPTDPNPGRAEVRFAVDSPLFSDLAGPNRRATTHAFPEWHADAIRPDAFEPGGPLERFEVLAKSTFCSPGVALADLGGGVLHEANGGRRCSTIPEAFRSRDRGWPIIGTQFHAEQRDFASAAPGDPPESVADPRLFMAGVYEDMVDAYLKFAP
jgi:hypothetical protein